MTLSVSIALQSFFGVAMCSQFIGYAAKPRKYGGVNRLTSKRTHACLAPAVGLATHLSRSLSCRLHMPPG
jgi:hypothetical protein